MPYSSLIRTLCAFIVINKCLMRLSFCLVFCCYNWKARYICFVCVLQLTTHPCLSLLSFILPYKAVLHTYLVSFILSHCLHLYLNNYFETTFADFLFLFFSNKLNKSPNFQTFSKCTIILKTITAQTLKHYFKIYNGQLL